MRVVWALVLLPLVGCAGEELVFRGDWSCSDKPNKRPDWFFSAKAIGPPVRKIFAEPIFKNLVSLGAVELEPLEGSDWGFEGKLPTDLEVGVEIFGQDIGVDEKCDDVTSVVYDVILKDNGESATFHVKKGERGDKMTP